MEGVSRDAKVGTQSNQLGHKFHGTPVAMQQEAPGQSRAPSEIFHQGSPSLQAVHGDRKAAFRSQHELLIEHLAEGPDALSAANDDAMDAAADAAEEAAVAGDAAASRRAVLRVIRDLEERNAVHTASMAAVERSREWRDYDAHAHLELGLLRLRYSEGEPMTAQRRAQMQAHLRAKQLEVMEEHATQAADAFVRALSPREAEELRATMLRIDAPASAGGAGGRGGGGSDSGGGSKHSVGTSAFDDELRDALAELSLILPALQKKK